MIRFALLLAAGWLLAGPALAGPPKVERTIGKEPAYQSKAPKYGLLVFGPEGKDRVWFVHDGDTLYVDRNGNGDLTAPDKKVAVERKPGRDPKEDGYSFDVGELTADGRTHKGLSVYFTPLKQYANASLGKRDDVKAILAKDPEAAVASLRVDVEVPGLKGGGIGGRVSFSAGPLDLTGLLRFADSPAGAPVIHLGGPFQVTFYGELPSLRVGRGSELVLVVGTEGIGPGTFAMVDYEDTIPREAKPVAEITYAPARANEPLLREKFEIRDRC
jgi:hypothetical protein